VQTTGRRPRRHPLIGGNMLQSYPVILTPDENETMIAEFPDVPEAIDDRLR
jgi:hypothetical protein